MRPIEAAGIGRHRALADRPAGIDPGRRVHALAVQQHQRLVRRKTAQRGGMDMGVAIRRGGRREGEGRHLLAQDLARFGIARRTHVLAAQHVDRHRGGGHGAVGEARAGDDDPALLRRAFVGWRVRGLREGGDGKEGDAREEQEDMAHGAPFCSCWPGLISYSVNGN